MKEEKGLTKTQEQLALRLFDAGAIKFGAFRLKLHEKNPDAPLSPIYITLRTPKQEGPLTPDTVEMIGQELFAMVKKAAVEFDLVTGIPRAGEPFAEVVSFLSGKPRLKLGKKAEEDRRKIDSIVSGDYRPGQRVLLVDDLITQADTKKEAIGVCEEAKLIAVGVVVLVDRQQGGTEQLRKAGYDLHVAFPLSVLLDYYVRVGRISQAKRDEVMDYIAANRR
jgi:uridine monophosphate synthetase